MGGRECAGRFGGICMHDTVRFLPSQEWSSGGREIVGGFGGICMHDTVRFLPTQEWSTRGCGNSATKCRPSLRDSCFRRNELYLSDNLSISRRIVESAPKESPPPNPHKRITAAKIRRQRIPPKSLNRQTRQKNLRSLKNDIIPI